MDLSRVIIGPIVTEKTERLKADRTHTLHIASSATKIDVKNALKKFYEVDAVSVRIMRTVGKARQFGKGNVMQKRAAFKKAVVTLSKDSKTLDLANFKS